MSFARGPAIAEGRFVMETAAPMDRPLDVRVHRARLTKRVLVGVSSGAVVIAAFAGLSAALRPSLTYAALRTARVDSGPLEASISASGTVVPEVEKVLASPIDARVIRILKRPGA